MKTATAGRLSSCALTSLIKYAFRVLGLNQLYCNVLSNNLRSLNPFQKQRGFTTVGLEVEWVRSDRMAGRIHASTGQSPSKV